MNTEFCAVCRFWLRCEDGHTSVNPPLLLGHCRRRSPNPPCGWHHTEAGEWCGEFEPVPPQFDPAHPPQPGDPGYGDWSWNKALEFLRQMRSPDMPVHQWLEMIHKGWMDYHELVAAVAACRDINDSGEEYKHQNADGAQALANLFSMVDGPQFDEADAPDPEKPHE